MAQGGRGTGYGRFLLLWGGELISAIGGGLTSFGLGVYIFQRTGSAGAMALVTLLGFLPTLVLSVPAGVLADRHDRRVLMMLGDGLSAIGIAYILLCMMRGEAQLWEICVGVTVSSAFSSLLEPAYRATVSDLLTKEHFSRASGMISLAGSARYLVSPALAAALLAVGDIKMLLLIDICTFFPTVAAAAVVHKEISQKPPEDREPFGESLKAGWRAVRARKGVLVLVLLSSAMTCFMGVFQVLAEPMVLAIASASTLGVLETVCACGMLVSSLWLGARGIRSGYAKWLSLSLLASGACMAGFGLLQGLPLLCVLGFAFFACLPVANNCLDYLVRTNIADDLQGRAWGLIGFLSQMGYVVAYACSGAAADGLARAAGLPLGRSAGLVISIAGALLCALSLILFPMRSVRMLEKEPSC